MLVPMSRDASVLRCPQCGAATRSEAHRCLYCRARLATVSCPRCFALTFAEAAFCANCGARRERREEAADARCPGCRSGMQSVRVGATTMLECDTCDGMWVDAGTFERLCADRESQAAVLHHRTPRAGAVERRVSYRPCVACGTMMNRVNFAKLSGTIVDVCSRHGTFLDAGELQAIVGFIQSGGLERARQRQIEDLKDAERRLREQAARLRSTRYDGVRTPPAAALYQARGGFAGLIALLADE